MNLIKGDIIEINTQEYIIIESLNYNNEIYLFVNKLNNNDDLTEEFYILKQSNDTAEILKDNNLINILLDKFKDLINKQLELLLEKNKGDINE